MTSLSEPRYKKVRDRWGNTEEVRVSAFTSRQFGEITYRLRDFYKRLQRVTEEVELSTDDLMLMLIRPEHREVLEQAASLLAGPNEDMLVHRVPLRDNVVPHVEMFFRLPSEVKFLTPDYVGGSILHLHEPYLQAVKERFELALEFAKAMNVLEILNNVCNTASQVRFFLSGIEALHDNKGAFASPRNLPLLPKEFREACKNVNTFIARAMLLPERDKSAPYMSTPEQRRRITFGMNRAVSVKTEWGEEVSVTF